jgi:hypothetical protein
MITLAELDARHAKERATLAAAWAYVPPNGASLAYPQDTTGKPLVALAVDDWSALLAEPLQTITKFKHGTRNESVFALTQPPQYRATDQTGQILLRKDNTSTSVAFYINGKRYITFGIPWALSHTTEGWLTRYVDYDNHISRLLTVTQCYDLVQSTD